jgi:hypothetical protein
MNLFSPDELVRAVDARLAAWTVPGYKIARYLAKDPWHPYEIIAAGPRGLCVILKWSGAVAFGDDEAEDLTLARQRLELFLSWNFGLAAKPEQALTLGDGERPSLLKTVALLIRRVREMDFKNESDVARFFKWKATEEVVTPEGVPLAAYKITFELDTDVEETEPQEI